MIIHVVQPGDTIQSIADHYGVSVSRLIINNGLENPLDLVHGQCIVVTSPESIYKVKEGDTLDSIAASNNVTVIQLLQNNPFLSDRAFIYPDETLVISYRKVGSITTHGNTVPYINKNTLRKTLPFLTYLSVLNYTATKEGKIITYYDDTEIIQITKEYGVVPLMLLTTLTIQGEANIGIAYDILLNDTFQNIQIDNILNILKTKGYRGVNLSLEYINVSNLRAYTNYFSNIAIRLNAEGYLVFVTINPNTTNVNNVVNFEQVDYSFLNQLTHNIIFMNYEWATKVNPPSPISSIYNMNIFLEYITKIISTDKLIIGMATLGYDWELPYSPGLSSVNSLTLERAIDLARIVGATIQFDEVSQTPFFLYQNNSDGSQISHIVWFIDARSINALLTLRSKYALDGIGIWNITIYNPQLWLIINSQYDIVKVIND